MSRRTGRSRSIKQLIKNHRNVHKVRNAQIAPHLQKYPKLHNKSINKLGVGGGFKGATGTKSLSQLAMLTPKSVQMLHNFDHMNVDQLLMRKGSMFDLQTML